MQNTETRNSEVRASFVRYCEQHPDERFWQALRNWSGHEYVLVQDWYRNPWAVTIDTFAWEGRDHGSL